MAKLDFHILSAKDQDFYSLIANWYASEWKIPEEKTIQRLQTITSSTLQFQVLVTIDAEPVATAGVYDRVSLVDQLPRLGQYKHWLALVYTVPAKRQHGYGASLCQFIQHHSKTIGIDTLYLFTDTAERLYRSLGWEELEKVSIGEREVVVMERTL